MFGFPFITSLVLAVSALVVVSFAVHKGVKSRKAFRSSAEH